MRTIIQATVWLGIFIGFWYAVAWLMQFWITYAVVAVLLVSVVVGIYLEVEKGLSKWINKN